MALAGITSTRIFQNPHGQIWLCGWLHSWRGQEHTLATKSHGRGREWRTENRNPTYTKCPSFPSLTAEPHGRWCWWDNFPEKKCNPHGSSMVPKWWTLWLIHAFKSVLFIQTLRWLEWWRSYALRPWLPNSLWWWPEVTVSWSHISPVGGHPTSCTDLHAGGLIVILPPL